MYKSLSEVLNQQKCVEHVKLREIKENYNRTEKTAREHRKGKNGEGTRWHSSVHVRGGHMAPGGLSVE